jgi:hypothetical protein
MERMLRTARGGSQKSNLRPAVETHNKYKYKRMKNTNKIAPVVTYGDVGAQMKAILQENRGKAGVYR